MIILLDTEEQEPDQAFYMYMSLILEVLSGKILKTV